MTHRILVHGVPDTPFIWSALIEQLGAHALAPSLPGFCAPPPAGFGSTKDEYAKWLVDLLQDQYATYGPLDIFGHDWGALLTLRAASLRPDLINSWAISGAAIDPDYGGHFVAHIWITPLLGEIAIAASPRKMIEIILRQSALPPDIARHEAAAWSANMRRSILALYRSANALRFEGDWVNRLEALPKRGLLIWGAKDPYVPVSVARRFATRHGANLLIERNAGHWAIVERAKEISGVLLAHWQK
ncbi:alpha/beta hydrolase [Bradyrhizobium septentrionale]|uniref:Alpha/beta hydrolase n=1 Tax=Bradyrhizobium septentrionale TaxID=1404411 RepID=A0A973VVP1_9BRAD|nr:alpha/beta hydrolase [Bradyrhizobium septentrionale]UGY20137.1 alpha/beta hydrolase [Bradyrhizobium septentrionale]UGY28987.1 alpha/beta hydrolase [Bradyrhizobium septentrionale]